MAGMIGGTGGGTSGSPSSFSSHTPPTRQITHTMHTPPTVQTVRHTYQMPTRFQVEDQLISVGPVVLTLRQGFVLLLGACVAVDLWHVGVVWVAWQEPGLILRVMATGLSVVVSAIWAFVRVADRTLEGWLVVIGRYLFLPKQYRWVSVCQSREGQAREGQLRVRQAAGRSRESRPAWSYVPPVRDVQLKKEDL